jgi:hypothetical protein
MGSIWSSSKNDRFALPFFAIVPLKTEFILKVSQRIGGIPVYPDFEMEVRAGR